RSCMCVLPVRAKNSRCQPSTKCRAWSDRPGSYCTTSSGRDLDTRLAFSCSMTCCSCTVADVLDRSCGCMDWLECCSSVSRMFCLFIVCSDPLLHEWPESRRWRAESSWDADGASPNSRTRTACCCTISSDERVVGCTPPETYDISRPASSATADVSTATDLL